MGTREGDNGEQSGIDERISNLHEAVTELQSASTEKEVYDTIIEAAVETLGFESCAVCVPVDAVFDERAVSESTPFEPGTRSFDLDEGIIGKTFQTGETIITENALENDDAKPSDESIVSGISVPLDDKGVFQGYSSEVGTYDGNDAEVADLLCAHATAALDRIERDRKLKQKNEQLEQFASFVSHDLRNPLSVAKLRLDLAQKECNSEHLDDVSQAHDRMETLIDELLMLAKAGQQADNIEPIYLPALVETCWQTVDTADARLVTETDQTIHADRNRLRQLLENLVRNAVEHGSTTAASSAQADGASVTITIGDIESGGFYVADDGPGIPETDRPEVFESGYSSSEDGTGYGLAIVEEIVEGHGWSVTVMESADGGARFEIRL
jgi:signal transduction histidine kinase